MTTDNTSDPLNQLPLLSEEMERTLRLWAWRDEIFRKALIADPKGVIGSLFPQWFPDGKVPDSLTIKIIEEEPSTHHIVLPPLSDQVATPTKAHASDFLSQFPVLRGEVESILRLRACKDETFRQQLIANPKRVIAYLFPQYFSDGKAPEQLTYKVIQQDPFTHHIVLPALPDEFVTFEVPEEEQLELIANMGLEAHKSVGAGGCVIISHDGNCSPRDQEGKHKPEPKRKRIDVTRDQLSRRDGKTQEGSKPESEDSYGYGREDKRRRTDINKQSS